MKCYLCQSSKLGTIHHGTRDINNLNVIKCLSCGLVFLEDFGHIDEDFYSSGEMLPIDMDKYLETYREENEKRLEMFLPDILGKTVLDFGCGAGGFIRQACRSCRCSGVELDRRFYNALQTLGINMYSDIDSVDRKFEVVTLFHVIEHLKDPRTILEQSKGLLEEGGKIIIETPNSQEALLSLYNSKTFADFTYWGCHLYLFDESTLVRLVEEVGFKVESVKQIQRYPMSNHLYWLLKGKPGGHEKWSCLNHTYLDKVYKEVLTRLRKCDSIAVVATR